MEEQAALYAQARENTAAVDALRRLAGLPPVGANANRIITYAKPGYSMHNFGLTFDVVTLDAGKPVWNVSNPVWQTVGRTGKECRLEWAGYWKRLGSMPISSTRTGSVSQRSRKGRDRRRHGLKILTINRGAL